MAQVNEASSSWCLALGMAIGFALGYTIADRWRVPDELIRDGYTIIDPQGIKIETFRPPDDEPRPKPY